MTARAGGCMSCCPAQRRRGNWQRRLQRCMHRQLALTTEKGTCHTAWALRSPLLCLPQAVWDHLAREQPTRICVIDSGALPGGTWGRRGCGGGGGGGGGTGSIAASGAADTRGQDLLVIGTAWGALFVCDAGRGGGAPLLQWAAFE